MSNQDWDTLVRIIKARKTEKILGDVAEPTVVSSTFSNQVQELVAVAGYAPFHKESASHQRQALPSAVPWRLHLLDGKTCRQLLAQLKAWGGKYGRGKIPQMLATAGAMVQVTWLPDDANLGSLQNQEHLMAASAVTQNLLLLATAKGIHNYWSSGGVLRDPELFELLGIPQTELLVGSIFLFPTIPADSTVSLGKNRGKQEPTTDWSRWVTIQEVAQ